MVVPNNHGFPAKNDHFRVPPFKETPILCLGFDPLTIFADAKTGICVTRSKGEFPTALTLKGTMIRLPSGTGWSDPENQREKSRLLKWPSNHWVRVNPCCFFLWRWLPRSVYVFFFFLCCFFVGWKKKGKTW